MILVRHGETNENKSRIIQGHLPGDLTKEGVLQAKKLAQRLAHEKFEVIISSDLKRAVDTTKIILKQHKKIPVIYTKIIRERNYGILHGKSWNLLPDYVAQRVNYRPKRGESLVDLRKRAIKAWDSLRKSYYGKSVLIVSHGSFNRQLLGYLLNKTVKESLTLNQSNASVNIIETSEDSRHKVHLIGCTKHL